MSADASVDVSGLHVKHADAEGILVKSVNKFSEFADLSLPQHKIHKTDKSAGIVIRTGESNDGSPVPYFICTGTIHPLDAKAVIEQLMLNNHRRHEWCPAWGQTVVVEEWEAESDELKALLGDTPHVKVYLETTAPVLGGLISSRCFIFGQVSWVKDGKRWVCITSVDQTLEGDLPPAFGGLPRGTMYVSGTVAKDNEDGKGCEVSSLVQTVPGGAIPNWAANKGISSELTSFFTYVNKVFAEEKK